MIRRPPRSTLDRSSAASDVYKRQRFVVVDDARELVVTRRKMVEGESTLLVDDLGARRIGIARNDSGELDLSSMIRPPRVVQHAAFDACALTEDQPDRRRTLTGR